MRATFRDAYSACTWTNCLIFAGMIGLSILCISGYGYVEWRRYVAPTLIFYLAVTWWRVASEIAQDGLSRIVNAASVGLGIFAILFYVGAVLDSMLAPVGYFAFGVFVLMLLWINFHSSRVRRVLHRMPIEKKRLITESSAVIVAQMQHEKERGHAVLASFEHVKQYIKQQHVT